MSKPGRFGLLKTKVSNQPGKRFSTGFTLIELLVVISIIVLLAAMLIPALNKIRDLANRAVCANNIRQHLLGLTFYAEDYDGKFPCYGGMGFWLWDLDRPFARVLVKNVGLTPSTPDELTPAPDVFYCDSNIAQKRARQRYWDYHHPSGARAPYRVVGYFFILDRLNRDGTSRRGPIEGSGNKKWISTMNISNPGDAELVVDITMSDSDTDSFTKVLSGGARGEYTGWYDSTSHVKSEYEGLGGNIGFVDGHVKWRPFNEMEIRWTSGSGPHFWW